MRVTLIALLCVSCQRAPSAAASNQERPAAQSSANTDVVRGANTPAKAVVSVGPGKWMPQPAPGKEAALVLRFGASLFTLACHQRGVFFAGYTCSRKIGDLVSVHMHDMGAAKTAKGKMVTFDASGQARFMSPLVALNRPDKLTGKTANVSPGPLDGVGIWPASAAKSLVVTRLGAQELMTALADTCAISPSWPTCRYVKERVDTRLTLDAIEVAGITSATKKLPGAVLLEIRGAADVQLDDDAELERVYDIEVEADDDEQDVVGEVLGRKTYSMVLVREGGRFSQPEKYQVMAATDLNGDKRAELLLSSDYYEGVIYTLVTWTNGRWRKIAELSEGS